MTPESLSELKSIPAGYVQPELFNELARLAVLVALEIVPCRLGSDGNVEVLLTQRPGDDPHWPSLWHNPGTILRPSDTEHTLKSAQDRLLADELAGIEITSPWYFHSIYLMSAGRGTNIGIVTWVEVADSPEGTFFPVDQIPENSISELIPYVLNCAEAYTSFKRGELTPTRLDQIIT